MKKLAQKDYVTCIRSHEKWGRGCTLGLASSTVSLYLQYATALPSGDNCSKPVVNSQLDSNTEIKTSSCSSGECPGVPCARLSSPQTGRPAGPAGTEVDRGKMENSRVQKQDVVDKNTNLFQNRSKAAWAIKSKESIFPNYNLKA